MAKDCILVTGAAGFIGTALRRVLVSDLPIVGIDSFVADVHPNGTKDLDETNLASLYIGNVLDSDLLDSILADWNPRTIVHLAAETGTGVSAFLQSRHVSNNSLGTAVLLESLERNRKLPEAFLLSSSRAVYGDGYWYNANGAIEAAQPRSIRDLKANIWSPRSSSGEVLSTFVPQNASQTPTPSNVYALTKLSQEKLVQFWCDRLSVKYQILRFQNVYGPGQSPNNPYTGIVNVFGKRAFLRQPISVFEDGNIIRDFIYIDDIISGLRSIIENPDFPSGISDLGSGIATSIIDLANLIASKEGSPPPVISGEFRHGDVRAAVADSSTLLQNWSPKTDLAAGLDLTLDWLRAQPK
jgi:dTDP-L-rhamnose 4-epimerase